MKTSVITVLLFVIICLCGFSCKKDDLPRTTTSGEDTMGFYIDGVKWIAHSDDFFLSKTSAKFYNNDLLVRGVNYSDSNLELLLSNPKEGQYQFSTLDNIEYNRYSDFHTFTLDINDTSNILFITHFDEKIISGNFSFKLKSPYGEIVSITSGRFDISIDH